MSASRVLRRAAFRAALVGLLALAMTGAFAGPAWGQASAASQRRVVDRAERLRDSGQPNDALRTLADHLARAPGSAEALRLFGEIAAESGQADQFLVHAEAGVAAAPGEPTIRRLWVDALIQSGLPDSALAVARAWVSVDPEAPGARVALADAHLARADTSGAIDALGGGDTREVLPRLADLLLASGHAGEAVRTWVSLLSLEPPLTREVTEDLRGSGASQPELLDLLREAAAGGPGQAARAAALVSLRLGHGTEARRMAEGARAGEPLEEAAFLRDYVREADEADLPAEVAWAARELIQLSPRPVDRMRWQALAADQALAAGDTGSARRAFVELARESSPGEGPHDLASRRLFSLLAADPDLLREAAVVLRDYQVQYPDSTRAIAAMHGELAIGHARGGDLREAESVLVRARGRLPGDALGPVDAAAARLSLFAGHLDSALVRAGRSANEPDLAADELTRRLQFVTLMQAADSAEVTVLGTAVHGLLVDPAAFDPGPPSRALAGLPGAPGRATVLTYFAGAAHAAGRADIAQPLWRQVAERFPTSPEAPQALLALARATDGPVAAAWLERLIVGYPESALAPIARRLLTDLERREGSDR